MTTLAKPEILKLIKAKKLIITPYNKDNIGPASIDLTLDNVFRTYKSSTKIIRLDEKIDVNDLTDKVVADEFILKPHEAILGITKEKVTLPDNICGRLEGRSSFARLGLQVHTTAGFVQPGTSNKTVLEISNVCPFNIVLVPGIRFCQMILIKTSGRAKYKGKFSKQDKL